MKNVIAIYGESRTGKDTVAEEIKDSLEVLGFSSVIIGNADRVREVAEEIFWWNKDKDENGRQLLINVTETGYNYNSFFWEAECHNKLKAYEECYGEVDFLIVNDCRYLSTKEYWEFGGKKVFPIKVSREEKFYNYSDKIKSDRSENEWKEIDFFAHIRNDYSLLTLRENSFFVTNEIVNFLDSEDIEKEIDNEE